MALEDLQIWPRGWTRGLALEVGEGGKGTDSAQLAAQQVPDLLRVSPVARGEDRIARQALLRRCARRRCPLRCRVILIPPNVGRAAPLGRRVVLTPLCIIEWRHVTLPVLLLKLALLLLPGQPPHSFRGWGFLTPPLCSDVYETGGGCCALSFVRGAGVGLFQLALVVLQRRGRGPVCLEMKGGGRRKGDGGGSSKVQRRADRSPITLWIQVWCPRA